MQCLQCFYLLLLCFIKIPVFSANSVGPDQIWVCTVYQLPFWFPDSNRLRGMETFSGETTVQSVLLPSEKGYTLKGKNLLLLGQILSF